MKKLTIESFFQPELPGPENKHKFRSSMRNETPPGFPYTDPKVDLKMTSNKALGYRGNPEEIEEAGLFKFSQEPGSTAGTNVTDINYSKTRGGADPRRMNNRDLTTNLSVKDFFDDDESSPDNQKRLDNADAREETKARIWEVGERYKMPQDVISTKQPFKNGLPVGKEDWRPYDHLDKEEEPIDKYLRNPDEKVDDKRFHFEAYASDKFETGAAGKKVRGPKSDLAFFSDLKDANKFIMNTEEEIEQRENGKKKRRKRDV